METDLRYPIGQFQNVVKMTEAQRLGLIDEIAAAPGNLRAAVAGLTPAQLDTEYRPGGWTVRQVVHHMPDSHMNAFVRFKLALTENEPTIKPYDEAGWANLADVKATPVEISFALLDNLHVRWVALLRALTPSDLARKYHHPELGLVSLDDALALYAWHGRHHVAHVTSLRERRAWL